VINEWISAEFHRLAEIIEDYDAWLELRWIPPEKRESQLDKAQCYAVVDVRTNKIVLFANELDSPTAILARLWGSDSTKGNVLSRLDAHNAAVKAMQLKEDLDKKEAELDFSLFVFNNRKNFWVHDGRKRDADFRDLGSVRKVITD
jgi:hypothetical protein